MQPAALTIRTAPHYWDLVTGSFDFSRLSASSLDHIYESPNRRHAHDHPQQISDCICPCPGPGARAGVAGIAELRAKSRPTDEYRTGAGLARMQHRRQQISERNLAEHTAAHVPVLHDATRRAGIIAGVPRAGRRKRILFRVALRRLTAPGSGSRARLLFLAAFALLTLPRRR